MEMGNGEKKEYLFNHAISGFIRWEGRVKEAKWQEKVEKLWNLIKKTEVLF